MRGPVAPPQVPLSASRAQVFDDFVRDAVERLERHVPQIADIDFVVQEVPRPQGPGDDWQDEAVPLGAALEARKGRPAQVVVYRRPVEIRAKGRDERALLVHEVVVEQVADVLGLTPEAVDPRYGEGAGGGTRAAAQSSSTPISGPAAGTVTVPRSSVRFWTVNIEMPSAAAPLSVRVREAWTGPPETVSTVRA